MRSARLSSAAPVATQRSGRRSSTKRRGPASPRTVRVRQAAGCLAAEALDTGAANSYLAGVVKVGCAVVVWCVVAASVPRAWAEVPAQAAPASRVTPPQGTESPGQSGRVPVPKPPDRGRFAALWVVPVATHRFQGAGLEAGYRYQWLAG